jgi:hypothetical protein
VICDLSRRIIFVFMFICHQCSVMCMCLHCAMANPYACFFSAGKKLFQVLSAFHLYGNGILNF